MTKLNFAHLCDHAFVLDGRPSLIGMLDTIVSDIKPLKRDIYLVANFKSEDKEKHKVRISMESPSGKEVREPHKVSFGPPENIGDSYGFIIKIPDIMLEEEGEYKVLIFVDDKEIKTIHFSFELKK